MASPMTSEMPRAISTSPREKPRSPPGPGRRFLFGRSIVMMSPRGGIIRDQYLDTTLETRTACGWPFQLLNDTVMSTSDWLLWARVGLAKAGVARGLTVRRRVNRPPTVEVHVTTFPLATHEIAVSPRS